MDYSLKGKAYELIKQNIIICNYKPNTILSEAVLMQELDMSRTPIREALCMLEQEQLVRILPKRGIVVTDISISEVNMIFEERQRAETYIISRYMQNINRATLEGVLRQMASIPMDEEHYLQLYGLDDFLHRTICEACPNIYIARALEHVLDQSHRLRFIAGKNIYERQLSSTEEHVKIIEAILRGKTEEAVGLASQHVINSRDATISALVAVDISTRIPEYYSQDVDANSIHRHFLY